MLENLYKKRSQLHFSLYRLVWEMSETQYETHENIIPTASILSEEINSKSAVTEIPFKKSLELFFTKENPPKKLSDKFFF